MKPIPRNVLLFLALASFQGAVFAQDNPPGPKPPQSEVRPALPQGGERSRPEAEGEKPRGQEPQRPMNPERGRGESPQHDKHPGDRGEHQPDHERGQHMNQDGGQHRGPSPRDGGMQHKGPPDGQRPKSGPRDEDHGPRMNQDGGQPRGPGSRDGGMQHKGPPDGGRKYQAQRQGPPHRGQRGMKNRQHGHQNFGQNRPMPPMATPHGRGEQHRPMPPMASPQGRGDQRGPMPPQFQGQQQPRFQPPQQGGRSMHSKHQRGSRHEHSMRQGPPPQRNNSIPQRGHPHAPTPNHGQDRRNGGAA